MMLYKFMSQEFALQAIRDKRLKISNIDKANDPFEFNALKIKDDGHYQAWEDTKEQLFENRGMICLSAVWDNPLLWGHYADNHYGIALGFQIQAKEKYLLKVKYVSERIKCEDFFDKAKKCASQPVVERNTHRIISTKFRDWSYEKEYRFYCNADEKNPYSGLYFFDFKQNGKEIFKLRKIILGIRSVLDKSKLEQCLKLSKIDDVSIIQTQVSRQAFSIVKRDG